MWIDSVKRCAKIKVHVTPSFNCENLLEESWSHLCDHGCMMRDAIAEVKCWIFCEGASFATPRSLELRSWGDPIHIKNQTVADSHCFSNGVNSAKRQQDVWILLILQYLYIYYDVLGLYSSSLWRFHRVPCSSFTEIWSFGAIPSTRFWTFAVDVIQDKPRPPVQKPLRRPGHASSVTESSLELLSQNLVEPRQWVWVIVWQSILCFLNFMSLLVTRSGRFVADIAWSLKTFCGHTARARVICCTGTPSHQPRRRVTGGWFNKC